MDKRHVFSKMRMTLAALILIMNYMNTNAQTTKGGLQQHAEQPYLTLNNGVRMPQVGLGLYMIAEGGDATALKARIEKQHGVHTVEHAEKIGLGSRKYHIVKID